MRGQAGELRRIDGLCPDGVESSSRDRCRKQRQVIGSHLMGRKSRDSDDRNASESLDLKISKSRQLVVNVKPFPVAEGLTYEVDGH